MTTLTVQGRTATITNGTWRGDPGLVADASRVSQRPMRDEPEYVPDLDRLYAQRAAYWLDGTVSAPTGGPSGGKVF